MANLLVAYATTEGHTRKVAEFVAGLARKAGHDVNLLDLATSADGSMPRPDCVILAGSVHRGEHQSPASEFVKQNLHLLQSAPSLFLSISLSAAVPNGPTREEAVGYARRFLEETGWTPVRTELVPGALLYSRYDFLTRITMKLISRTKGYPTDTTRDYEFTDWDELRSAVGEFLDRAKTPTVLATC